MPLARFRAIDLWIVLSLGVLTAWAFAPLRHAGFVNFDDPVYVSANPHVLGGLSWSNVIWGLGTVQGMYRIPVTWLSLMADASMFGSGPTGFHVANVGWHVVSTVVLFLMLVRMSGARWPSALVAALFALHPLHVESVAWITERKDVLSTFFGWVTIACYVEGKARQRPAWLAASLLSFAAGLAAKPMLVTMPILLMLIDFWPLDRWKSVGWRRLVAEKLGFWLLSVLSGIATFLAQAGAGAVVRASVLPLDARLMNAAVSLAVYLWQTIWPAHLALFYPFPTEISVGAFVTSVLLLAGVTALSLRSAHRWPWLTVGWLWFLVTVAPVSGVVQAGAQARADRFTYLPLVGVFIALAWSLERLRLRTLGLPLSLAVAAWVTCLTAVTHCPDAILDEQPSRVAARP